MINSQRPIPESATGLGVWKTVIYSFSVIGVFSNFALLTFNTPLIENLISEFHSSKQYQVTSDDLLLFYIFICVMLILIIIILWITINDKPASVRKAIARQDLCHKHLLMAPAQSIARKTMTTLLDLKRSKTGILSSKSEKISDSYISPIHPRPNLKTVVRNSSLIKLSNKSSSTSKSKSNQYEINRMVDEVEEEPDGALGFHMASMEDEKHDIALQTRLDTHRHTIMRMHGNVSPSTSTDININLNGLSSQDVRGEKHNTGDKDCDEKPPINKVNSKEEGVESEQQNDENDMTDTPR